MKQYICLKQIFSWALIVMAIAITNTIQAEAPLFDQYMEKTESYSSCLNQLIVEYVEALPQSERQEISSRGLGNCYDAIVNGKEIFLADIKEALSDIMSYISFKINKGSSRAPRPDEDVIGQVVVGPDNCELFGVLSFLRNLQQAFNNCCEQIQQDIIFTSSAVENIDLNLNITLSLFDEFVQTFSSFEQIVVDLETTITLLETTVSSLVDTVSLIDTSVEGTFTALNACCQELTVDFQETGTLIVNGFDQLFVDIQSGFNSTTNSFLATWTIIQDLINTLTNCQCEEEFQSTWTIIQEIIDSRCTCESEFQQTWTILANISSIVGDVCSCNSEFQQTWTIIQAGFNGTFTNFDSTFTVINNGFRETWELIDNLCGYVSLFDEEVVSNRNDYMSIQFPYGVSSFDTTTSIFAGGFVNSFTSMAIVGTGTGSTAFAQLRSVSALRYRAGHEADLFFTAMFPNGGAPTSTQWIGLFDEVDGMAVGFNNTTFSILYRNNGIDTIVPQSSFNVDPLDGTGQSGFVLNPQRLNVFRIVYGWLGASPIRFQIVDQTGDWITCLSK